MGRWRVRRGSGGALLLRRQRGQPRSGTGGATGGDGAQAAFLRQGPRDTAAGSAHRHHPEPHERRPGALGNTFQSKKKNMLTTDSQRAQSKNTGKNIILLSAFVVRSFAPAEVGDTHRTITLLSTL